MKDFELTILIIGVPEKYRGTNLEERLNRIGFDYSRIEGVDGSRMPSLEYDSKTHQSISNRFLGRRLTKGELCCAMAHEAAYERFIEAGTEWALILEDDCELNTEFEILSLVKQVRVNSPSVVQLYGIATYLEQVNRWLWMEFMISKRSNSEDLIKIKRSWELPDGTYGYLINQAAAKLAVNKMKNSRHVTTADWPAQWRRKVNFMVSRQPLVSTKENDSLIDLERALARSIHTRQKKMFTEIDNIPERERNLVRCVDLWFTLRMTKSWVMDNYFLQMRRAKNFWWRFLVFSTKSVSFFTGLRINRN